MKICAIIAEFNPFHFGHKYIIDQIRSMGFTHVFAVMSGNYVQRGEPAITSKWARAQAALLGGVDLVIEIPTAYAVSSAERFARAGVFLANSLGVADSLAFGSSTGNIDVMRCVSKILDSDPFLKALKKNLTSGVTFAKAREQAIFELSGDHEILASLRSPNDILGIEYINALKKIESEITPIAIKRTNSPSASDIRREILGGGKTNNIPSQEIILNEIESGIAPCDLKCANLAIMAKLRGMALEEFKNLPDVSEGLENRIFESVKISATPEELLQNIKTKRYTLARIRRIVLSAFLGITKNLSAFSPPYLKILGANVRGFEILNIAKSKATLPILTKFSETQKLETRAKQAFECECKFTDIYSLLSPKILPCGREKTERIIKIDV